MGRWGDTGHHISLGEGPGHRSGGHPLVADPGQDPCPESAVAVSNDVTVIYDDLPSRAQAAPLPMRSGLAIAARGRCPAGGHGLKTKVTGRSAFAGSSKHLAGNGQLELSRRALPRPMVRTSSSGEGGSSGPIVSPISTSRPTGIPIP